MKKIVIAGLPRGGTCYMHLLLKACGIECGHEQVFGVHQRVSDQGDWDRFPNKVAEVSWRAAPYLENLDDGGFFRVHLTRDPLKQMASWIKSFLDGGADLSVGIYGKYLPKLHKMMGRFEAAAHQHIQWNSMIEDRVDTRMKVEEIGVAELQTIGIECGIDVTDSIAKQALDRVLINAGTRGGAPAIDTKKLPDSKIAHLSVMASRYGYQL